MFVGKPTFRAKKNRMVIRLSFLRRELEFHDHLFYHSDDPAVPITFNGFVIRI